MRYERLTTDDAELRLRGELEPIIVDDEIVAVRLGPYRIAADPETTGALIIFIDADVLGDEAEQGESE